MHAVKILFSMRKVGNFEAPRILIQIFRQPESIFAMPFSIVRRLLRRSVATARNDGIFFCIVFLFCVSGSLKITQTHSITIKFKNEAC